MSYNYANSFIRTTYSPDNSFNDDSDDEPFFPYEETENGDKNQLKMFFLCLLEHFCDNNIQTNGKTLTQDKLFKIICKKLYESGVLDSIEFLEKNLSEYKKKCSAAWTEFIRDALDAKDSFTKETNNNKISNINNKLPARSFSVCDINSSSSESGYNSLEKKSRKTKTNTIFLTVKEKNGEEPNGDKNYFRSVSNDPLRSSTNSQFSECNSRYSNDFIEEQKLGHGGFGAVYRVRHTLDQLQYAVKKIQFRKTSSPTKLPQKILREVICLARLDHINVVRYYSAWLEYQIVPPSPSTSTTITNNINKSSELSNTSSNVICSISDNDEDELEFDSPFVYQINLYIQMQLCSFSLKEWMERPDRKINYEENIAIFVQIARGLAYVHAEGLIHRDLKPSNIFVSVGYSQSQNLSTAVIKLGDFGVATFIKDEAERAITQQAQQGSPESLLSGSANTLSSSFKNDDFELPSSSFASSPMAIKRTNPLAIQKKGSSPLLINTPVSYSLSQSYDQNKQSYRTTGIGTVAYASPEQLRKDTYDEKTDIYSLGIIFLELFYIFGTRMERAHILQDLRNNRKLPSEFQMKYPKEASMVLWLTAPEPSERPSAEELLKSDYLRDYQSVDDMLSFMAKQLDERDKIISKYKQEIDDLRNSDFRIF